MFCLDSLAFWISGISKVTQYLGLTFSIFCFHLRKAFICQPSTPAQIVFQEVSGSALSLQLTSQDQTSLSPYVMCSLNPSEHSLPGTFNRSRSGSSLSIYNQLQFPSTSNYGSMKRKKRSELSSASSSSNIRQEEYYDNNVKIWSLEYTVPPPIDRHKENS